MALHLRAWALDAQILGAEIERLAVVERNRQRPAVLVQAQFGRPRLRRCITHLALLANELGPEPRPRRRRSIASVPTIASAQPEQTAFPSCDVLLTWRKTIGPPRGSGGWSSRAYRDAGVRGHRRSITMAGLFDRRSFNEGRRIREGRQSGATRSGGVHAFIANGLI